MGLGVLSMDWPEEARNSFLGCLGDGGRVYPDYYADSLQHCPNCSELPHCDMSSVRGEALLLHQPPPNSQK